MTAVINAPNMPDNFINTPAPAEIVKAPVMPGTTNGPKAAQQMPNRVSYTPVVSQPVVRSAAFSTPSNWALTPVEGNENLCEAHNQVTHDTYKGTVKGFSAHLRG